MKSFLLLTLCLLTSCSVVNHKILPGFHFQRRPVFHKSERNDCDVLMNENKTSPLSIELIVEDLPQNSKKAGNCQIATTENDDQLIRTRALEKSGYSGKIRPRNNSSSHSYFMAKEHINREYVEQGKNPQKKLTLFVIFSSAIITAISLISSFYLLTIIGGALLIGSLLYLYFKSDKWRYRNRDKSRRNMKIIIWISSILFIVGGITAIITFSIGNMDLTWQ